MASKRTSAELKQEAAALSDQLAGARNKLLNFALLIGKDGLFLETDLKKSPEVLWRAARKNGGGPKGAQGQISVTGKSIQLTCDSDEAPAQLPKLVKRFLSERGLAYSIVLITPSGQFTDGEEQAANDDPARDMPPSGSSPLSSEDTALRRALLDEFDAMSADLGMAKRSRNKGAAKKVEMLAELFRTCLETDLKKSRGVLTLLSRTVDEAVSSGVARDRSERRGLLAGLEADIDAVLARLA